MTGEESLGALFDGSAPLWARSAAALLALPPPPLDRYSVIEQQTP